MTDSKYKPVFFDIETTGFNPMTPDWYSNSIGAEVTAVAIGTMPDWCDDGDSKNVTVYSNNGEEEYSLIKNVNNRFSSIARLYESEGWEPFLVGHNIYQFDVMYWAARCARKRLDPWPVSDGWRRLDTMRALQLPEDYEDGNTYHPGQQDYADYLGLEYVDDLSGSDMPDAFVDGRYDEIATHVRDDVSTLMDIFMIEREDMVEEFWGHYEDHDSDPLDEDPPVFQETFTFGDDEGPGVV